MPWRVLMPTGAPVAGELMLSMPEVASLLLLLLLLLLVLPSPSPASPSSLRTLLTLPVAQVLRLPLLLLLLASMPPSTPAHSQSFMRICASVGRAAGSCCSMAPMSSRAPSGTLAGKAGSAPDSTAWRVSCTSRPLSPLPASASPARL